MSESGALNPLQELLGDDLIGVHINAIQRRNPASVHTERLHRPNLIIFILVFVGLNLA
jgi:hypothetical protein